jgi:transcriptional regulator with XRE-family HTH domain
MPHKKKPAISPDGETFGNRLARLRKAAGFTQYTLADAIGISNRMVAYYETQSDHPPTHLLPAFAKALSVSSDQLLGIGKITVKNRPRDTGLWRRFTQVEKLSPQARRQVTQYLDTVLKAWKDEKEKP